MQKLNRAGITLCFTEAGRGTPPLLFVHGWSCDHTFFRPQFAYFQHAHRVVAVDLRGHGESDKPRQDYTIAAFADDLAWLCGQTGLDRPVVIGHAMGGLIVLELAARYPQVPAAIVTLATPVLLTEAACEPLRPVVAALWTPSYREAQRQMVEQGLFLSTDDAARKAHIVDRMASTPQWVMASAFEHTVAYYRAMPIAACTVPWLALFASWVPDVTRLRALCPHVTTGQTVGAGAFHQLEVPEQVNPMIERFLAVSLPPAQKSDGSL
jgi:pimeloyl-ACP methyl ester carboxylesterase